MKTLAGRVKVNKPIRKVTSIRINPEVLQRAQHAAIDRHTTLSELIEQGLELVLASRTRREPNAK
jgi:hypothetical protein